MHKLLFGPVLDPEHERDQKNQYDPKAPIQKTVFTGKRDGKRHEKRPPIYPDSGTLLS